VQYPLNEKDHNIPYEYIENYINNYENQMEGDEKNKKKRYEYLYDLVNMILIISVE
jgi:hypothetical protein